METREIIAELRKAVAVGDSPVFCGGTFIPKLLAMEAADRLEEKLADLRKDTETLKVETNVYDQEEIYPNCTVQVWTNSATGEVSWGWWRNG